MSMHGIPVQCAVSLSRVRDHHHVVGRKRQLTAEAQQEPIPRLEIVLFARRAPKCKQLRSAFKTEVSMSLF